MFVHQGFDNSKKEIDTIIRKSLVNFEIEGIIKNFILSGKEVNYYNYYLKDNKTNLSCIITIPELTEYPDNVIIYFNKNKISMGALRILDKYIESLLVHMMQHQGGGMVNV